MIRRFAVVAIIVMTAVSLHYAVWLPLVCEMRVTRALDALDDAADRGDVVKRAAAAYAESSVRDCGWLQPADVKLAYVRGTAHRYRGEPKKAIDEYINALGIDRRPEIYIDLGIAQLDALNRDAAIASFVTAGTFAPKMLDRIPYADVRTEAIERIRAQRGAEWIP